MNNKNYKKGYVYIIISPNNRLYVGSTINIFNRISLYRNLHCKNQTKLYNSIKKYGWNNHEFKIVWQGNIKDMLYYENKLALKLNTLSKEHLNCKIPKAEDTFSMISEETREKMSKWQIGRKMSKEAKKKMSDAKIGKNRSKESVEKSAKAQRKPVLQYDLKGNFIKEWESASFVSRELKINKAHIGACCRKQRKTAGKFKWGFKNKI